MIDMLLIKQTCVCISSGQGDAFKVDVDGSFAVSKRLDILMYATQKINFLRNSNDNFMFLCSLSCL